MQNGFDTHFLLHQDRECLIAHSCRGSWTVRDVDGINADRLQETGAFYFLPDISALWRNDFHHGHKFARCDLCANSGPLRQRDCWSGRDSCFPLHLSWTDLGSSLAGTQSRLHDPDMVRRGPTTSAHQTHSSRNEFACITGHILGRAQVDIPAFNRSWHTRIRLGCERQGGEGAYPFNNVQHCDRPHAAVTTYDIYAPAFDTRSETLRSRSVEAVSVLIDSDLSHHGNLRIHIPGSQNRLVKFLDVTKRLEHKQVNATVNECCDLLTESGTSFLEGGLAEGF